LIKEVERPLQNNKFAFDEEIIKLKILNPIIC